MLLEQVKKMKRLFASTKRNQNVIEQITNLERNPLHPILKKHSKRPFHFEKEKSEEVNREKNVYKKFSSEEEVSKWAEQNYRSWNESLSMQEKEMIRLCLRGELDVLNDALRNRFHFRPQDPVLQNGVFKLHQCLQNTCLPNNVVVYRRLKYDVFNRLVKEEPFSEKLLKENGFLNASLIDHSTKEWKVLYPVCLEIYANKGVRGAYIGFSNIYKKKHEILFDKEQLLQIFDIKKTPDGMHVKCILKDTSNWRF